ncbi:MAG: DNA repair protein RecN [Bdellovibrionaceae bacterium]|nr:DNA repair protein RecN [Bdellovibrionales bacterium]MCB9084771.1 DNA repair protein RecN [Pseudobdellovibrionaceae bacterium]
MLVELNVSNFAIINAISLQFAEGLNILSGETGAGKSVLLKSLALLMGDKSQPGVIRTGAEVATIEGAFDLSRRPDITQHLHEMGIETPDDHLVVRRILSSQGKSRVYLNGALTSLNTLKEIICPLIELTGHQSAPLIEMTGQHDNRNLQSKSYHLDMVDRMANCWDLRLSVQEKYDELRLLKKKRQQLEESRLQREQRLDFLRYQRDEIANLNLRPGEEDELQARFQRAKNSSKLASFAGQSEEALYGDDDSSLVRIHRIIQKAQELADCDPGVLKMIEPLQTAKTLIEEVVYELREYGRNVDIDPSELDGLEARMSQLRHLQKKYGSSVEVILGTLERISEEIDQLENCDEALALIDKQEKELSLALKSLAQSLHEQRKKACSVLTKKVNQELRDLNMKEVTFGVDLKVLSDVGPTGISDIEFTTKSGEKDQPRPLAKFASGGELSRTLLALKRTIGLSELPRTFLFDEVDAGVSGMTAEMVGRKLKAIAKGQQVICVTHLPQVASFADHHFFIHKKTTNKKTQMEVVSLTSNDEKISEIARLLSGEKVTKTSRDHARQLLAESRKQ